MGGTSELDKARRRLADGHADRAILQGWRAVDAAMRGGDRETVSQVRDLAQEVAASSSGRLNDRAVKLETYCQHCLDGVGNGVQSSTILERVFTRSRRRKCPDCAESIAAKARVCPHCGYRLAPPPETGSD